MEINQLRYVVCLAECKNFSQAATSLFVTQPALSQQIQKLEEELGIQLFKRSTRKCTITSAGEKFVKHAKVILKEIDIINLNIQDEKKLKTKKLTIGLAPNMLSLKITQYIKDFEKKYPNIKVNIEIEWSYLLKKKLAENSIDFAIINVNSSQIDSVSNEFTKFTLWKDYYVVISSTDSFIANKKSIGVKELAKLPLLYYNDYTPHTLLLEKLFKSNHLKPNIVCICMSVESLTQMVKNGTGVSLMTHKSALEHSELQQILFVPIQHVLTVLLMRNKEKLPETQNLFLNYFMEIIKNEYTSDLK